MTAGTQIELLRYSYIHLRGRDDNCLNPLCDTCSSLQCEWPYSPRLPYKSAFWIFSVSRNKTANVGCRKPLPGWLHQHEAFHVTGHQASYALPTECVAYTELRRADATKTDQQASATQDLEQFTTSTLEGGSNVAAIIVLGQVSFLPALPYDVFLSLVMEDDEFDLIHTSRTFLMRDFVNKGSNLNSVAVRCLMSVMIALLSWWLITQSDVIRGIVNRLIFTFLILLAFADVSTYTLLSWLID